MFYVLYSPSHNQYLSEDDEFVSFDKAEQVRQPDQFLFNVAQEYCEDIRWVGPLDEGDGEP